MAVLGGVGHVWGAFTGAALVKLIEDYLKDWLPRLIGTSGNYEIIVFGLVLVVVLKYASEGLWPHIERLFARFLPEKRRSARLGRRRAAARAQPSRRRASCCSRSTGCASSSAAWWPSTTCRSRSAPARSSA